MGEISFWHLAIVLVFFWPPLAALTVVPVWKILDRVGLPGWLSLLSVIPIVGLVALWVFAFGRWPVQKPV